MLKTAVPQCDSDSFPPRGETDSRGFKGSPQDCPDFRCQPQVQYRGPQAIHPLTNCLQIQVLPWPPQVWWFTKMTDRTQESTTFAISFILEDTNQNKSKEETHKERFGRAANAELLCTLPVELGHVSLLPPPVTSVCVPTRTCPWALVFGVFIEIFLWQQHWSCHWTRSPALLASLMVVRLISPGAKPQSSVHLLGPSGVTSPHPELSH